MSRKRDHWQMIRAAEERGWTVTLTRGGHVRMRHPSGAIYFAAGTPSDGRASINMDRDLRRLERQAQKEVQR